MPSPTPGEEKTHVSVQIRDWTAGEELGRKDMDGPWGSKGALAAKIGQEPPGLRQELCCQQAEGSDPSHLLSTAETLLSSGSSFELLRARQSYFS